MIFISSSCSKNKNIGEAVDNLASHGFRNIEISGGSDFSKNIERDLIELKRRHVLQYFVHNYVPFHNEPFVLNLSSTDKDIYIKSLDTCKRAIDLAILLGSDRYSVHAGFRMDISTEEIGKPIRQTPLIEKCNALDRFSKAFETLRKTTGDDLKLYVENNVISKANLASFKGDNPFLLTDVRGYLELRKRIDFRLLLDVAHLKVSANSVKIDFLTEFKQLFTLSNYFHISDNDGFSDQNRKIEPDSSLMNALKNFDFKDKVITLEIYGSIDDILQTRSTVQKEFKIIP